MLIPCLHDEHYAYQPVFKVLFERVGGLVFNAQPEKELALKLYGTAGLEEKSAVVGMGFDAPQALAGGRAILERAKAPYLLYSGRKEQGKNLDLLLDYFAKSALPGVELILIGSGKVDFLDRLPEGVRDLGFVSEEEKQALMQNALALVQPSTNESFSIVLMEAWLQGAPAIVNGLCPVTRFHAVESGGGLFFENAAEFKAVVEQLRDSAALRRQLAVCGKRYVEEQYSWPAVTRRMSEALRKFTREAPRAADAAYG